MTQAAPPAEEVQKQAGTVLSHVAGYVAVKAMNIGLHHGLFEEIGKHSQGLTVSALAEAVDMDPFYLEVWCRAAYGAEVLELNGDAYT